MRNTRELVIALFCMTNMAVATSSVKKDEFTVDFTGNDIIDDIVSREYSRNLKKVNPKYHIMLGDKNLISAVERVLYEECVALEAKTFEEKERQIKAQIKQCKQQCEQEIKELKQQGEHYIMLLEQGDEPQIKRLEEIVKQNLKQENIYVTQTGQTPIENAYYRLENIKQGIMKITNQNIEQTAIQYMKEIKPLMNALGALSKEKEGYMQYMMERIESNAEKYFTQHLLNALERRIDEEKLNIKAAKTLLDALNKSDKSKSDALNKLDKSNRTLTKLQSFENKKLSECFKGLNDYFIFVGNNPDEDNSKYKIKRIILKKYLDKPTNIVLNIPGSIDKHPVKVSKHAFFDLFHLNEMLSRNLRLKIVFTKVQGRGVLMPKNLASAFNDFQYKANGFKVVEIDFSGINSSPNVEDMTTMFENCQNLTYLDLSNFDTSDVKSMKAMFKGCVRLKYLKIDTFNTRNVDDMGSMFKNCRSLQTLNLSNFDTSNVSCMDSMFAGCEKLEQLDLSKFDVSNVRDMDNMFDGCKNLVSLNFQKCSIKQLKEYQSVFNNCKELKKIIHSA